VAPILQNRNVHSSTNKYNPTSAPTATFALQSRDAAA